MYKSIIMFLFYAIIGSMYINKYGLYSIALSMLVIIIPIIHVIIILCFIVHGYSNTYYKNYNQKHFINFYNNIVLLI